jgi:hypothetical protein
VSLTPIPQKQKNKLHKLWKNLYHIIFLTL